MNETCENAEKLLSEIVTDMGFDLKVSSEWTDEGCLLNLSGDDAHLALAENGELLDAFEVLLFQTMGRSLDRQHPNPARHAAVGRPARIRSIHGAGLSALRPRRRDDGRRRAASVPGISRGPDIPRLDFHTTPRRRDRPSRRECRSTRRRRGLRARHHRRPGLGERRDPSPS